ncbi:hypothetical protein [Nocardia cyriacigeorgica]|uniref:hypothetical protein n=1 Tax=Nocardia cyriacigeorgica TaxID=135487 RepID=UPI002456AC48|nr:hypothetical protein [Nocardia cyriacigeorgica]
MNDTAVHVQETAQIVPVPWPWDPNEYVTRVAEYRQRPITVCPIDANALSGAGCGTGSGLWIAREHDDIIMVGTETEWHAGHIIAHEIGHMLLGHGSSTPEPDGDVLPLQTLMPLLDPASIRSVLWRRDYGTAREQAAESFAGLVMVEATLPRRRPSPFRSTFFLGRHR